VARILGPGRGTEVGAAVVQGVAVGMIDLRATDEAPQPPEGDVHHRARAADERARVYLARGQLHDGVPAPQTDIASVGGVDDRVVAARQRNQHRAGDVWVWNRRARPAPAL